jgi:murein DD-endopeptidase MepM/ murein hydrolase activator NlpD
LRHAAGRACLVALLLWCLLVGSAGSLAAPPRRQLERTESSLEAVQDRIRRQSRRALSLKERINLLGDRITSVQMVINELDGDIARIRARVLGARTQVEQLNDELDDLRNTAIEQAVELYKAGSVETLDALLNARSVAELGTRIDLLGVAAQENTSAIVRYGRLRATVHEENRALFRREAELAGAREAHADVLEARRDLRVELHRHLARLNQRIGHDHEREGRLVKAARRLKKRIVAAQAEHSVRILGTSTRGFVWPLNGPVTSAFGERWGGMHLGVDIDGYTGQPVVAAKDGVVIYASSSMSGYGNAVVVDHGTGISTLYAHLSAYAVDGGPVEQGRIIGYVGCTGNCYGDHLHFEVRVNGDPVDPAGYLP